MKLQWKTSYFLIWILSTECMRKFAQRDTANAIIREIWNLRKLNHSVDICVVGGGLAGMCSAIAAARNGAKENDVIASKESATETIAATLEIWSFFRPSG